MELGGTSLGTQYDQVHVEGELPLGGTLKVELIDTGAGLFAPAAGDSFDILDWQTVSGTFSALQLPTLAGTLVWNTSKLYTTGVISVGLPGDYNNNGSVEAADYVTWRKNPGGIYAPADYNIWRAHVGQPFASGSGATNFASAAVPEPSTLTLMILAAAVVYPRWRRNT